MAFSEQCGQGVQVVGHRLATGPDAGCRPFAKAALVIGIGGHAPLGQEAGQAVDKGAVIIEAVHGQKNPLCRPVRRPDVKGQARAIGRYKMGSREARGLRLWGRRLKPRSAGSAADDDNQRQEQAQPFDVAHPVLTTPLAAVAQRPALRYHIRSSGI